MTTHPSRGSAATKSADHSSSTETSSASTDPALSTETSIASIELDDNSYFIQYYPEIAEKLSKHNSTYSVSGRCLSIVFNRMLFWSRYAKHRFNGKNWYYKNQTELSQETSFSIKQINRALKVLVELGLLVREKFQKHYYRQVYFYHIPTSPHTKEPSTTTRISSRSTRSSRVHRGGSSGSETRQQFHSRTGGAEVARAEARVVSRNVPASVDSAAPGASTACSAAKPMHQIDRSKGFGLKGSKCPIPNQITSTSIKHTLKTILEKCELYGREDIYRERFGLQA